MKKSRVFSLIIIALITIIINTTIVNARYADITDEESDAQAKEQMQEQENLNNVTEVKSTDNYLQSLKVEGYTLTPEFDKQVLEYTIKEDITSNEINIKATANNEKASISGIGTIQIEEGKGNCRIDVTAESGSVRTYIIKINKTESTVAETNEKNETEERIEKNVVEEPQSSTNNNNNNNNNTGDSKSTMIYVIIAIVVIVIALLLIKGKGKKNKKRKKHKGKH